MLYDRERLLELLGADRKVKQKKQKKYNFDGTIYTSYFGKLNKIRNDDFTYIAICRFPPKYLEFTGNLIHVPVFAPSQRLVLDAKDGTVDHTAFEKIYNGEIRSRMLKDIKKLAKKVAKGDKICLLCYEKSEDFCHRHILCEYIKEMYGIDQIEL